MRIVIALGGNALLKRGEPVSAETQRRNAAKAAAAIAPIAQAHELVITHGNGPQVGLLALQAAQSGGAAFPLDVLGAESEGMIGYVIEQELASRLPGRDIATLLTQVAVDPGDPAFKSPTKPVGPFFDKATAERLSAAHGWAMAQEDGGFRRVVPSPLPQRVLEIGVIRRLVEQGVLVICAGGGGVPVTLSKAGAIKGVEAVIDKDRAAALLARALGAAFLLILTDVPAVYTDWSTPHARALSTANPEALKAYRFAPGSMGPKVEAATAFVAATGGVAAIGALTEAPAILAGRAGTTIRRDATLAWHSA
jgi:carbamate kinase